MYTFSTYFIFYVGKYNCGNRTDEKDTPDHTASQKSHNPKNKNQDCIQKKLSLSIQELEKIRLDLMPTLKVDSANQTSYNQKDTKTHGNVSESHEDKEYDHIKQEGRKQTEIHRTVSKADLETHRLRYKQTKNEMVEIYKRWQMEVEKEKEESLKDIENQGNEQDKIEATEKYILWDTKIKKDKEDMEKTIRKTVGSSKMNAEYTLQEDMQLKNIIEKEEIERKETVQRKNEESGMRKGFRIGNDKEKEKIERNENAERNKEGSAIQKRLQITPVNDKDHILKEIERLEDEQKISSANLFMKSPQFLRDDILDIIKVHREKREIRSKKIKELRQALNTD